MGEGESDTGRFEEISEEEIAHLRPELQREGEFRAARKIIETHADAIDVEPNTPMDALLDELLTEQKKPQPDMFRLADIRQRLDQEHALVMAQSVTSETALQHMQDRFDTQELNNREEALREIAQLRESVPGLYKDIHDMAEETVGDMAEEYPEDVDEIIGIVESEMEDVKATVAKTLGDVDEETVFERLHDDTRLAQYDFETLRMSYAFLKNCEVKFVEEHTEMLHAVSEWRKHHQQNS